MWIYGYDICGINWFGELDLICQGMIFFGYVQCRVSAKSSRAHSMKSCHHNNPQTGKYDPQNNQVFFHSSRMMFNIISLTSCTWLFVFVKDPSSMFFPFCPYLLSMVQKSQNNHLGCIKNPVFFWDIYHIHWCFRRISSSINDVSLHFNDSKTFQGFAKYLERLRS